MANEVEKSVDKATNAVLEFIKFIWSGIVISFFICLLWNFTGVNEIFNLPTINFFQGMGMYFIINFLFPIRLLKPYEAYKAMTKEGKNERES